MANHAVRDFFKNVKYSGFTEFIIPSQADPHVSCTLKLLVVKSSVNIPRKPGSWYPAAMIVNEASSSCNARTFDIGAGDTAVWLVQVTAQPTVGRAIIGDASVVQLHHYLRGDAEIPDGHTWRLTQCGHPADTTNTVDNALIWLGPTDVCDKTAKTHSAPVVAQDLAATLASRSGPKLTDNAILWFACGGDCCYADFASR